MKTTQYDINRFCPNQEEFLCGHGLLAAAEGVRRDRGATALKFVTSQGMLLSAEAMSSPDVVPATWKLTLPLSPVISDLKPADEYRGHFAKALGIDESLILELSCNALKDVNIELDPSVDYSAKAFTIDAMALMKASPPGTRSQVVTSAVLGDSERDFAKRVFAYGGEGQLVSSFWTFSLRITHPWNYLFVSRSSHWIHLLFLGAILFAFHRCESNNQNSSV